MEKIVIIGSIIIFGYFLYRTISEPEPPRKANYYGQHGVVMNARKKQTQEQPIKVIVLVFFIFMLTIGLCEVMNR